MANKLYPTAKAALLVAGLNLVTGTVKAQLVDTGAYTYAATDAHLSDIPAAARIGAAVALTGKGVTGGVFSASGVTFTGVPTGLGSAANVEAVALYLDTGDATTSQLIALIDTATGLPLTPNGGNVTLTWDQAGIFAL